MIIDQCRLSTFQVVKVIYEKLVDLTGNPAVPLVLVSISSLFGIFQYPLV